MENCRSETIRFGSCYCRAVTFRVTGEPLRVGICHCADCRKESGSSFVTFGIWPRHSFEATGEVKFFQGRGFCPECGSRIYNQSEGDEVEIRVGSLDMAPTDIEPTYEVWVKRRENWLAALDVPQFEQDRQ